VFANYKVFGEGFGESLFSKRGSPGAFLNLNKFCNDF
jgi:hypothetical protein